MQKTYTDYIVNIIAMRISYNYAIELTEDNIAELKEEISKYTDQDYINASNRLANAIKKKLKSFGLDNKSACMEATKWRE